MSNGGGGSTGTAKKRSALDARTTLDNLHHLQMNELQIAKANFNYYKQI